MIHNLRVSIALIKSMRWQEKRSACMKVTALSVWSVSAFQGNIRRSKSNQSCWDGGGGMCRRMKEFLQKGIASVHITEPEGELTVLTSHFTAPSDLCANISVQSHFNEQLSCPQKCDICAVGGTNTLFSLLLNSHPPKLKQCVYTLGNCKCTISIYSLYRLKPTAWLIWHIDLSKT